MTGKTHYWICDIAGTYALVEGAEQRDEWVKVRGWAETVEPGPTDQVHVVNDEPTVGGGRLPYAALEAGMDGLGWKPGPPPEPVDVTRDPAFVDQPPVAVTAESVKPKTTAKPSEANGSK